MANVLRAAVGPVRLRRIPWLLIIGMLALMTVGAAFIRSAHSAELAAKHVVFSCVGLAVFLAAAFFDYRHLLSLGPPLYVAGLLALAALFGKGVEINYSRRWFDMGFFLVQPSEPMKYVLVIVLAAYFSLRDRTDRFLDLLPALALTGAPMLLIVLEPDLGTAMLMVPVFAVLAFLGGVPTRHFVILGLVGACLIAFAWYTPFVLKYQRDRVMALVDPANADPNAVYNAAQASMAISAGGWEGQGWGQGVLTRLRRIPEQYADFIFPVIAEEWGFVRTTLLVGLYVVVLVLIAEVARSTPDRFGRLIAGGVLTLFAVQTFLHMAVSLRLAPVTGLTLPLVSYGGSSLLSTCAGLGLVASVRMHPADM